MTDKAAILASLVAIINEATAGEVQGTVTEDKSFADDLDVDSLTMVEIAVLTETQLGVRIPDDEIPRLITVGDAVTYIAANSA